MAISTAAPARPAEAPGTTVAWAERFPGFLRHPVGLGLISAGLLWLSFPPQGWQAAAWVALVPLFLVVADRRPVRWAATAGLVGGFAFWAGAVQWVRVVDPSAWLGWLAMALALALFWLVFVAVARWIIGRTGLPAVAVIPVAWVALEYARAHVLSGFPWYYLAHTQYRRVYWTQIADFAGSLGLSFLIALVNAAIAEEILAARTARPATVAGGSLAGRWRLPTARLVRVVAVVVGIAATLGYGAYRVHTAEFRQGPRVALLQTDEVQHYDSAGRKTAEELYSTLAQMIRNAVGGRVKPDLIVWPETAYPFGLFNIDPELAAPALDKLAEAYNPGEIGADLRWRRDKTTTRIGDLLKQHQVPMMVGLTTHEFGPLGYARYNSSVLFRPGLDPQSYHKLHLVPFGEYVPLIDIFPWLIKLTPFTPDRMPTLRFGTAPAWYDLGAYRLAAAICFEDTVPHVVRRFFSEVPDDKQPDLIINLSNDGWFHETVEHEMHLAVSVFRCIENRAPMARAVNTGTSALIDGNGTVTSELRPNRQAVLTVTTQLDDRASLYSRWGDWLGQGTLAATIGLAALGLIIPRRSPVPADSILVAKPIA